MADKTYRLAFGLSDGTTKTVEFKAPQGEKGDTGAPGKDGVSPTVEVSKNDTSTVITVTDVNGTKTTTIPDGKSSDNIVVVGDTEPTSGPVLWFDTN